MILRKIRTLVVILTWVIHPARLESNPDVLKQVPNSSLAAANSNEFISVFSPRMDFDRWKPLTGRGDPLRNDPTYDYEPPVLERVHYWADDTRIEREKHPERKSEVLVLGVSSRKPSIVPRPPMPSRRHPRPPLMATNYEDFSYKVSESYPMTILVPPPPPPPGHKPVIFTDLNDNVPLSYVPSTTQKNSDSTMVTSDSTTKTDLITSFAFQEANLIYQSSTKQDWREEYNKTFDLPNVAVSSDYAGWGPTTPFDDGDINDSHNTIQHNEDHNLENKKISFYKPIISEISPTPEITTSFTSSIFLPTALPPESEYSTQTVLWSNQDSSPEVITKSPNDYGPTTTEENTTIPLKKTSVLALKTKPNIVNMLASMMSMPTTDPDRSEDNIYAHASENINIFNEPKVSDEFKHTVKLTMQPPPFVDFSESTTSKYDQDSHVNLFNTLLYEKHSVHTHDPYLHMRYTTPLPTEPTSQDNKYTTEKQAIPSYLIIQGHSKVKTYGSKPKLAHTSLSNVIPNPNETNEVKHLHPIKDKYKNNQVKTNNRDGRAKNLKSLVDNGLGSIEIQEADIGIKYDVSDGSEVPIEIYKKGIVDNDDNKYITKKNIKDRTKRQIDIENLLPFDEDTLEEFVYNFFQTRKNSTGILGFIAKAITDNKLSSVIDELENDDNENDKDR